MKYVDHGKGGPASCLQVRQGPLPELKTGEVLVEVAYAGMNRPDIMQRAGSYPPPPGASPVLGLEVAGKVVARAGDVTRWNIGDSVCALTPGGGYAEYCAAPASNCLPIPNGLTLIEAAALPENYFTVWTNVFDRGRLKSGEIFLVHGGSSGIGLTAIQLAKAFGAHVYTTVGNTGKIEAVKKIGADAAINYKEQDWAEEISRLAGRQGVNCILDMVGGPYIQKNLQSLAVEGRLVQIAFQQGAKSELDCMPILLKRLTFTGSTLRPRTVDEKADIAQALLKNVWPLLEAKKVRPIIHAAFSLADVRKAHELMETSAHIGKIMLKVKGD
ncbi:MAG: NAD(P)H-quinone oxidoreductase [Syntrophobacteraceae bacterium]